MKQWVSCHLARLALSSLKSKGPAFSCGPALAEFGLGPIKFGVRAQVSCCKTHRGGWQADSISATHTGAEKLMCSPWWMQHHATLTIIAFGGPLRRSKHQNAGHKNRRGGDFGPQAYENSSLAEKLLALLRVHPARFVEMFRMFFCMLWILFWNHIFISCRHQRFHCWVRSFSQQPCGLFHWDPLGWISDHTWHYC